MPVKIGTEKFMTVANLNKGRPWRVAVGCQEMVFEPFVEYEVQQSLGNRLIAEASTAVNMAQEQSEMEAMEYFTRLQSDKPGDALKARRFVDKDGSPKTKTWAYPPIMCIDTPEGRKAYKQAEEEATRPILDSVAETKRNVVSLPRPLMSWDVGKLKAFLKDNGVDLDTQKHAPLFMEATKIHVAQAKAMRAAGMEVDEGDDLQK